MVALAAPSVASAQALPPAPALTPHAAPITIPGPLDGPLVPFTGAPATPAPLDGPPPAQPLALAPAGRSGTGLDAGNSLSSPFPGPLGRGTARRSSLLGACSGLALDRWDRVLALCSTPVGPSLVLVDPPGVETVALLPLPPRRSPDRRDPAGGTHFALYADGTALVPANDGTLRRVAVEPGGLRETGRVSLAGLLAPLERPVAVSAGFDGHDWVVGEKGTVIALDRATGAGRALALGSAIAADLATDPGGATVTTADALVRLELGDDGAPRVAWRAPLDQPATAPAVLAGGLVAVAGGSGDARLHVRRLADGAPVCDVPVFAPGAGRVTAGLVVAGDSVVVSNAHGYDSLADTELGATATGGMARVDVTPEGCSIAWTSDEISPSAQPVLSRATGLLHTFVKPPGMPDGWYLAGIDWRTGETRFHALAGEGLGFNPEGGPLLLAPDGAAYAGTMGGLVALEDRP